MFNQYNYTVTDRFTRYVQIDTQSDPASDTHPTTEKQKNLGRLLVEELKAIGITDAHMDEYCYVYATIPATTSKNVPVICLCAHMDTSPDCSGEGVKPIIHKNYDGKPIHLPNENIVIDPASHPDLLNQIGNDIITADGTTLLGADNKAGVAEIMDVANYLITHPDVQHGAIRILFTPDEEVGKGVDKVDIKKLGAAFGYTIDGESAGHLETETFSADAVTLTIQGVSTHPGFAKGSLESALKAAADIVALLPKDKLSPETTEGKQGFIHPVSIQGTIDKAIVQFIIRDFETDGLKVLEDMLKNICEQVIHKYPNSHYTFIVKEQYRNFKEVLDKHPHITEYAVEAIRRAGMQPIQSSVRGGTDGSRLSFMGLPCPNIFAGEHAFHSRMEWVSVQDMQKAVQTMVHLSMIWAERS